jgi:predicted ATPase/DNA-binding CsgD family transcriptional regulator
LLVDAGTRLLTLIGPGGVGKTRLAIRLGQDAAAAFADGVVFVSLAAIAEPALVMPAIARKLGLREVSVESLVDRVAAYLHDRRVLLILDNFEQVQAAAPQIAALLAACPDVVAIATSRFPLHVAGEQRFPVAPLPLPPAASCDERDGCGPLDGVAASPAVRLFVARAQAMDPRFALDGGNAEAIADICRRLNGLPLAIELAAAWVHVLSPAALLSQLEPRLPLLCGGGADQPARLRTMRDAIAWSYGLLSAAEARLFRRLGVFVGGFALDAVAAVAGDGAGATGWQGDRKDDSLGPRRPVTPSPSVLDLVGGLVDKSMLQVGATAAGETRYQMLDMVREFALDQLALSGEADDAAAAHAASILALAETAEPEMLGPDERRWRARLNAELSNVRAALTWALDHDVETALRIGAALWVYWGWQQIAEGRRWLSAALERASQEPARVRARALTTQGLLAALAGDPAQIAAAAGAALPLAIASGDPLAEARARWIAASSFLNTGAAHEAVVNLDRALELLAPQTSPAARSHAAQARTHRALASALLGDVPQAIGHCEAALAQARAAGSESTTVYVLGEFAGLLVEQGDTTRARRLAEEALERGLHYEGLWWMVVGPLIDLALLDALARDAAAAARRLGALAAFMPRTGLGVPRHSQHRIDRAAALARTDLGDEVYAAAWEAGRADPDAVIAACGAQGAVGVEVTAQPEGIRLTPRERDILRLLADGLSDKEMAAELRMGRRTVSTHVATIRAKLDAPSRSAAAAIAVRDRLV